MAEILASRAQQVLNDLELGYKYAIEDEVNGLVYVLGKIEDLWSNGHSSERVSDNMQRLRELAYDIEDSLETWAVEMDDAYMCSKNERKRGIRRLLRRYILRQDDGMGMMRMWAISELAFLGERYMEWFHEMFPDDNKGMEIVSSEVKEQRVAADRRNLAWPRQTYAHDGMVEYFVGMEDDLKQLVSLVIKDDHKNCVVSIWGVKGLGKTTLARKVYTHSDVTTHFNAFAWVALGQGFQFGNLLQHMLKHLGGGAVKNSTAEELKKEADEKKKKKKGTEELKKGADEKKKSVQEPKKDADEKKKMMSAEEQKIGAEEEKKKTGTEEQKKSSEENMIDQLKEIQRKKKCFIVIDGISEMSQWTDICSAFLLTEEGTNTRILLTTRDETIAAIGIPHQPRLLDEDKGWDLLQKYVFRGKKAADLGIAPKLGKEMAKKCEYLPSAISSLGRALTKIPLSEWHMVIDNVTGYLQSESNERSDDILVPRYDDMPYHLKQCFLYLGIFKEDEGVDSEDLTLLWMAEGMVKQESGMEGTVMDTAENYLRELADRNMLQVQVDELSANRRFMRLYLHSNVRESSLSLGEKEDFRLKVVDFSDGKQTMFDPFALFGGTRRLVIHFNKPKIEYSSSWTERLYARDYLRSLFFLNSDQEYVDLPVRIVHDFSEFKLLRVLHFVRCKFEGRKLPEGIEKLVNLRYFGILYCDLERLPSSISNFRNLYVLNVRANDDSKITIPNALSQMVRLKHLRLPNNLDHEQSSKLELDGLVDLETLVGFNADIHDPDSLYKLEKLRLLVTHAYSNDSLISIIKFFKEKGACMQTNLFIEYRCNFTSPEGLSILEEVLMCPNLDSLTLSMVLIQKFPNCGMLASSDITQIKLIGCKLSEDPMGALGKFLSLRKLCLGYGAFLGRKMAIPYTGFPKLEYLEFYCLPNLEEWKVDVGAMPRLSALTVRRCPKLKGIPKELASNNKSSLNNLEIELPPTALSAAQEAEYHQMFHFVKSRTIRKLDPLSSCSKDSDH